MIYCVRDDRCLVMVLGFQRVGLLWLIPTDGCGRMEDHGGRQALEQWEVHRLLLNVRTWQHPVGSGFRSWYATGSGEEPQCCVMGVCGLALQC